MTGDPRPPAVLRCLVRTSLPFEDREPLLQELDGLFAQRVRSRGRAAATMWYARQALSFVVRVGASRVVESAGGLRPFAQDARLAVRSFRQRPAFALAFAVTLAIGTGVLATVYTAARWLLLRPVPGVTAPEQLETIRLGSIEAPPHVSWDVSHPDYLILRERLPLGGALAAMSPFEVDMRPRDGEPRRVAGAMVTSNFFTVLGARIVSGRGFLDEEQDRTVGQPVAVLSHALARRVSPDGNAVGSEIRVNGTLVRVVGVTVPGFRGADLPGRDELWLPFSMLRVIDPTASPRAAVLQASGVWRRMIGRRPASVTTAMVATAANTVVEAVRAESRSHSYIPTHFRLQVFSGIGLDPSVRASVRRTLTQLGIVAAFLLCLAIANLANLALIESTRRRTTTAIRVALGASRARIARGVFVETALLALGGAALALVLAMVWSRWFEGAQLSEYGGALAGMRVDVRIVLFTMLAALVAASLAFFQPATAGRWRSLDRILRRTASEDRGSHGIRAALVAAQVALSLVLLVAANLLGRTVANLREIDLGFRPERLLTFSLDPHLHGYESRELEQLARGLEGRLADEGGVRGAGFISPSPLRSSYLTAALYAGDDAEEGLVGAGFYVTPGVLPALGARTIAGDRDWRADSGTAVLTRATLARIHPGMPPEEAIGRLVYTRPNRQRPIRIAAIIENLHLSHITSEPPPLLFRPLAERLAGVSLSGVVAAERTPASVAPAVRAVVSRYAPELPIFDVRSARAAVDLQFADRHAMARVASTLGVIGLLLAAVGLYGVLAAMVAGRRREIGIRGALGAPPLRILRRTMRTGLAPVFIGLPVGLVGAVLFARLLAPQLFGLDASDPSVYAAVTVALLVATAVAAGIPAWRATRVSPAEVLRDE